MHTWQFAKARYTADANGWTRFVSMQPHYHLIYREEEREMLRFCLDQVIGVIPWSRLARGRLTRPWDETTARTETDEVGKTLYADEDRSIVEAVMDIAGARGVSAAQVTFAWVAQQPTVTAPIVGATKPHHLKDALAALDVHLTAEGCQRLEAPYRPHAVTGLG